MKKFLLLFSLLFFLAGCSSLEIDPATSSEDEAQKILALGLSHEENLRMASKLGTPHLVKIVTLKLNNARDEKIQAAIDVEKSLEFAEQVKVSKDSNEFISKEISESLQTGILSTDIDFLKYYFHGNRDLENDMITHKLHLNLVYNSSKSRGYHSLISCDNWNNCEQKIEIITSPARGSNCKNNSCDYQEVFEVDLTDEFLRNTIVDGFSMRLISDKRTNKIEIPKAYLMGYLKVAQ
jgi:plasmid stability protein